jgi:hypothetical protein
MPFAEKVNWVNVGVTVVVATLYFVVVLGQLGQHAAGEIAYQVPLLTAVGAAIVLTIVSTILVAIGAGISSAIEGGDPAKDLDRKDERDKDIERRGEVVGYYIASAGVVGVMAITMLNYDHFWIANGLYASFAIASIVSSAVKIVAYHRGF